jgi:hypothetical protein
VPSAEADSESKIKHLDASLKASSTRTAQNRDFFSGLFSRADKPFIFCHHERTSVSARELSFPLGSGAKSSKNKRRWRGVMIAQREAKRSGWVRWQKYMSPLGTTRFSRTHSSPARGQGN